MVSRAGYAVSTIQAKGFRRKISLDFFKSGWWAAKGFFQARDLMRRFLPHVVVGCGGAVTAPVALAAFVRRVPTVIQEQNVIPGLTNRLLGKVARVIAVSFDETKPFFPRRKRVVVTGNPIRRIFLEVPRFEAIRELELDPARKTLVVLGGSLGAQVINEATLDAYASLRHLDTLQIVHITGERNFDDVSQKLSRLKSPDDKLIYKVIPYSDQIWLIYSAADLVLARAGASTVTELTALGKPALLVPYPYAPRAHQEKNARILEAQGGAKVIRNEELKGETVVEAIKRYLYEERELEKMRMGMRALAKPQAGKNLAKLVSEAALDEKSTEEEEMG